MKVATTMSLAFALFLSSAVIAQDKKLGVGDNAPGLDIEKWVKPEGKETKIQPGKVYVIEFWATWCGPCKKSIPHLTQLQKQYEDDGLVIVGISTDDEKTVKSVPSFVRAQADQMDYVVAIDRQNGTKRAWMEAAGKSGIPCAFIVDRKGRIAWIGNPHPQANEGFDEILKMVMTGRYDPKLMRQADPITAAARNARKVRNWQLAAKHYDELVDLDASVFAHTALEKFEMLLVDMDSKEKAYGYARELMAGKFASDPGALQMLAEKIATDPKVDRPKRDLDLALNLVELAQRQKPNDPRSMAYVAMVRFHRGEVDQAIELQKQAYFTASPKKKPEFQRVLKQYQDAHYRASMSVNKAE